MTKLNFENLTPEEAWHYNGMLEQRHVDALFDRPSSDVVDSATVELDEASNSLPAEDFLSVVINQLRYLATTEGITKGHMKSAMIDLLTEMEELSTDLNQSTEYTIEKINSAKNLINGKNND